MVAQSKKRATSKNTTNEKKEKSNDVPFYMHINYVTLNLQYLLQVLNHSFGIASLHNFYILSRIAS